MGERRSTERVVQKLLGSTTHRTTLGLLLSAMSLLAASCATAPANGPAGSAPSAGPELDRLAGTWVLVEGYVDGKKVSDEDARHNRITWKGNRIAVLSPQLKATSAPHLAADTIVATITVNATRTPHEMDIVYEAAPAVPALAIYEWLDNDRYRICIDRRGGVRPARFTTSPDVCQTLHVWQRQRG